MDDLVDAAKDLLDDLRAGKWRDAYWWLNHQWLLWVTIAGVDLGVHYLKLRMQRSMLGVADV
jgi:hypothetical protein